MHRRKILSAKPSRKTTSLTSQALFQQRPIRNHERMERWYTRALALIKRASYALASVWYGRNSEKKKCTPRSVVYSVRTLSRCLRTIWKCLGKVNLISAVLCTENHQSWCRCLCRKPQPIIFLWYFSMASQTWEELVKFHTTVWEIETTGWEIQEKRKNGRRKQNNRRKIRLFSQARTTSATLYFLTRNTIFTVTRKARGKHWE